MKKPLIEFNRVYSLDGIGVSQGDACAIATDSMGFKSSESDKHPCLIIIGSVRSPCLMQACRKHFQSLHYTIISSLIGMNSAHWPFLMVNNYMVGEIFPGTLSLLVCTIHIKSQVKNHCF